MLTGNYTLLAIPASFLAGFWLADSLTTDSPTLTGTNPVSEQGQTSPVASTSTTYEYTIDPSDNLSNRIDFIHAELLVIKSTLEQLSMSVHNYAATANNIETATSPPQAELSPSTLAEYQNNIYAQLSDPQFDLNKLNALTDFQHLPESEKKIILTEIARRLDSGEINKAAFLPGYKPTTEASD